MGLIAWIQCEGFGSFVDLLVMPNSTLIVSCLLFWIHAKGVDVSKPVSRAMQSVSYANSEQQSQLVLPWNDPHNIGEKVPISVM